MKSPMRYLVAAASALAVGVIVILTGGAPSTHLPRPPSLAANSAQSIRSNTGQPNQIFTKGATIPLTGCTIAVSGSTPLAGQTRESVTIQSAPGAWVRLQAKYPRFTGAHAAQADNKGTVTFALADPPSVTAPTVRLTATATLQKVQKTCQTQFTPQTPLVGCTVWESNPYPGAGRTTEVVTVRTTPGASVLVTAKYLRFTSVHRHRAANGTAVFYLSITHPTPGFRVLVNATASLWSGHGFCQTSFTPT